MSLSLVNDPAVTHTHGQYEEAAGEPGLAQVVPLASRAGAKPLSGGGEGLGLEGLGLQHHEQHHVAAFDSLVAPLERKQGARFRAGR